MEDSKVPDIDSPPGQDYSLKSLVHHIGNHASSGHYTADAIRSKKNEPNTFEWVSFDDSGCEIKSREDIFTSSWNQQTVYMLLYTMD